MDENNPWDLMSGYFDTSGNKKETPSGAADNIMIAWPVVLEIIRGNVSGTKGLKIIDYGCGGGGFARRLQTMGHQVTGVDTSRQMIEVAKKSYGKDIHFLVGDSGVLLNLKPADVITSVMTLQFIEDIDATLSHFAKALLPGGLLVFAVFNPDYVVDSLRAKMFFDEFDSEINPKQGVIKFGDGIRIPTYIRTAHEYTKLAEKYGFKLLMEAYPEFTKEFLKKFPQDVPGKNSEYLILGFGK